MAVRIGVGHRRVPPVRRPRPVQAEEDWKRPPRRHRSEGSASQQRTAQRRSPDGRGKPGRQADLPDQLPVWELGRAVLPRRDQELGDTHQRQAGWRAQPQGRFLHRIRAAHPPDPPRRRRRLVRLVLLLMSSSWWPWAALVLLGAYHGVNPGMGWLFDVARGMQEHSRKAVLSSLLPIAIGHEASIVIVVIAVSLTEQFLPPFLIRLIAALVLVSFGVFKLAKPRTHLGGFGMRVGFAGLAGWSFLMSTAHGAGLMLAPVLLGLPVYAAFHSLRELSLQAVAAASLHVSAMLLVMGIVSVVVYERVGLGILRRGWFNLDLGWSLVLIASGLITLFTALFAMARSTSPVAT